MQKEQKQTDHQGTGEQETQLGSAPVEKQPGAQEQTHEDSPAIRNPSGDDLEDARDGDEGSGRTV